MDHAVEEGEPGADEQRHRGLAIADRPHVRGDQAIGVALEGQERPADHCNRSPGALALGRLLRQCGRPLAGQRIDLRRRGLAREGIGAGIARFETERQSEGHDQH
jgi:hypothetical protein